MSVHERLERVFHQVFADDSLVLRDDLSADDVEEWDSLAHINLMYSIEETFGVQFRTDEFADLRDVGDLKRLLAAKGCGDG